MALAGYNAGGSRVRRWVREAPQSHTDLWVEDIPFKETRNYVKRVLSSNQTYLAVWREVDEEQSAFFPFSIQPVGEFTAR